MLIKTLVRDSWEFAWDGATGYARSSHLEDNPDRPLVHTLSVGRDGSVLRGFIVRSHRTGCRMTFIETTPTTKDGRTFGSMGSNVKIIVHST